METIKKTISELDKDATMGFAIFMLKMFARFGVGFWLASVLLPTFWAMIAVFAYSCYLVYKVAKGDYSLTNEKKEAN